jgi:predicted phosphodiesterase
MKMEMKNYKILLKKLAIGAFSLLSFVGYAQAPKLRFIAVGDSRTNSGTFAKVMDQVNTKNPELIIFPGDLWDGYSQSTWENTLKSRPNINALLNANKFLVAYGNHESCSAVQSIKPSVLKNNACTYSFTEGNVFFVSLGMSYNNYTYLEAQLKSQAAQDAKWRVIFHHYPIYSSGGHPIDGVSQYEALCDKYNVTFSVAGHCHNYDRSKVMFGRAVVFSGNVIPATQKGTIYMVSGGAGAPLYSVASKTWQAKAVSSNNFVEFLAYDDSIRVKAYNGSGGLIETFVRGAYQLPTAVKEEEQQKIIITARPNIFSTSTTIEYSLDQSENVEINILDLSGRVVKSLVKGVQPAGLNTVTWNGSDEDGNSVAAGTYMCTLISAGITSTQKLVLVK